LRGEGWEEQSIGRLVGGWWGDFGGRGLGVFVGFLFQLMLFSKHLFSFIILLVGL